MPQPRIDALVAAKGHIERLDGLAEERDALSLEFQLAVRRKRNAEDRIAAIQARAKKIEDQMEIASAAIKKAHEVEG